MLVKFSLAKRYSFSYFKSKTQADLCSYDKRKIASPLLSPKRNSNPLFQLILLSCSQLQICHSIGPISPRDKVFQSGLDAPSSDTINHKLWARIRMFRWHLLCFSRGRRISTKDTDIPHQASLYRSLKERNLEYLLALISNVLYLLSFR